MKKIFACAFMFLILVGAGLSYGGDNLLYGTNAGSSLLTSGTDNTIIGSYAAQRMLRGRGNTLLGMYTGALGYGTSGTVKLGYMAGRADSSSHKLFITTGYYPSYGIFGDFSTGYFGVNKAAPTVALDVTGAIAASTTIKGSGFINAGSYTGLQPVHNITAAADTFYSTTTPYTSAATNCLSGTMFMALPIAQKSTLFLQSAVAGAWLDVMVSDSDTLRIVAASGDSLITSAGAADRSISSVAGTVRLIAVDGVRWIMLHTLGTWTQDHGVQ